MQFDYEICYRRGKENWAADGLSRIARVECYPVTVSLLPSSLFAQIQDSWATDPVLQAIITAKKANDESHSLYTWHNN